MRAYECRFVVGFEETNLVGNVYYANHVRWQGRCREMFLRDHAPDVLDELRRGLALVTMRVSCEYLAELAAFDEVLVRMRLAGLTQNQVTMKFEYFRVAGGVEQLAARGEQQIACMRRVGGGEGDGAGQMTPAPLPESLRKALAAYSE